MSRYRFCLHDEDETLAAEEHESCTSDSVALQHARVLLARAPSVLLWRDDRFVDRVAERPDQPRAGHSARLSAMRSGLNAGALHHRVARKNDDAVAFAQAG